MNEKHVIEAQNSIKSLLVCLHVIVLLHGNMSKCYFCEFSKNISPKMHLIKGILALYLISDFRRSLIIIIAKKMSTKAKIFLGSVTLIIIIIFITINSVEFANSPVQYFCYKNPENPEKNPEKPMKNPEKPVKIPEKPKQNVPNNHNLNCYSKPYKNSNFLQAKNDSKFAYVWYSTSSNYFCSALVAFKYLKTLRSEKDLNVEYVLMYPKGLMKSKELEKWTKEGKKI